MKICIRKVLFIAFLNTQQLYCMNKENSIKIEQQETIKKILADKEMRAFLRNKLRPEILAQQRQFERAGDLQLLKMSLIGGFGAGFVIFASQFIGNIILNIFGGPDKNNKK